jgi:hypothetical protein
VQQPAVPVPGIEISTGYIGLCESNSWPLSEKGTVPFLAGLSIQQNQ